MFGDEGVKLLHSADDENMNEIVEKISGYVQPYKDNKLLEKAQSSNCPYFSSTSSISTPLIMLYYIFSNFRLPILDNIYSGHPNRSPNWMVSFRKPTSFYLKPSGTGQFAITSDEGILPAKHQVLMNSGHIMEFVLTHKKE